MMLHKFMNITQQVQKEDEARWGKQFVPESFELKHLWIPKVQRFTLAALYCLFHSI